MYGTIMGRSSTWTTQAIMTLLGALAASQSTQALAEPAPPVTGQAGSASNTCSIQGTTAMPVDLAIYDQYVGGTAIAKFTGAKVSLTAQRFPPSPTQGRVAVQTGSGTSGFRLAGYVNASRLPLVTKDQLPVSAGHLWIGRAQQVQFTGATASGIAVTLTLRQPVAQTFKAQAPCSAFTLTQGVAPAWTVPGNARGYVVKLSLIELFSDWRSSRQPVGPLRGAKGLLTWSTQRQGQWVNVQYHGAVVFDAWAKLSDLHALPPGELSDRQAPPITQRSAPHLQLADSPREVTASYTIPVHDAPRVGSKVIGAIGPGTKFFVLDTVLGWAKVLPGDLSLMPHGQGAFWVSAKLLKLARR